LPLASVAVIGSDVLDEPCLLAALKVVVGAVAADGDRPHRPAAAPVQFVQQRPAGLVRIPISLMSNSGQSSTAISIALCAMPAARTSWPSDRAIASSILSVGRDSVDDQHADRRAGQRGRLNLCGACLRSFCTGIRKVTVVP